MISIGWTTQNKAEDEVYYSHVVAILTYTLSACTIQQHWMILKNFSATAWWLLYKVIPCDQGLGECSTSYVNLKNNQVLLENPMKGLTKSLV